MMGGFRLGSSQLLCLSTVTVLYRMHIDINQTALVPCPRHQQQEIVEAHKPERNDWRVFTLCIFFFFFFSLFPPTSLLTHSLLRPFFPHAIVMQRMKMVIIHDS
ncbi:hypothetical protein L873DRAFT_317613 [Choiromyces venosus 120613-1]|uniref:Uncharacterized protein n=1 Tax=Choiromyces venosus 120613-1 TaxID=1336337 RepID=A0A3N4IYQ1_9PEZI|nr:hypothetical protein L873DRAFT_317613 [Choiromyces venosus 120613-1]